MREGGRRETDDLGVRAEKCLVKGFSDSKAAEQNVGTGGVGPSQSRSAILPIDWPISLAVLHMHLLRDLASETAPATPTRSMTTLSFQHHTPNISRNRSSEIEHNCCSSSNNQQPQPADPTSIAPNSICYMLQIPDASGKVSARHPIHPVHPAARRTGMLCDGICMCGELMHKYNAFVRLDKQVFRRKRAFVMQGSRRDRRGRWYNAT